MLELWLWLVEVGEVAVSFVVGVLGAGRELLPTELLELSIKQSELAPQ